MTDKTKRGAKPHPKPQTIESQALDLVAELNSAGIPQRDETGKELTLVERVRLIPQDVYNG